MREEEASDAPQAAERAEERPRAVLPLELAADRAPGASVQRKPRPPARPVGLGAWVSGRRKPGLGELGS